MVLKDFQVWSRMFSRNIKQIPGKVRLFSTIEAINKDIKPKKNFQTIMLIIF